MSEESFWRWFKKQARASRGWLRDKDNRRFLRSISELMFGIVKLSCGIALTIHALSSVGYLLIGVPLAILGVFIILHGWYVLTTLINGCE